MNTETLKSLGITEQHVIDAIFAENGRDVNKAKGDRDQLLAQNAELKRQLSEKEAEYNRNLSGMQDYSSLKEQVNQLLEEKQNRETEWQEKVNQIEKAYEVQSYVLSENAINPKAVMPFLDMQKIEWKDGKLNGVKEQVDALKQDKQTSFLFGTGMSGFAPEDPDKPNTVKTKSLHEAVAEAMGIKI